MIGALRSEVLERRALSKENKVRVFNAMVVPMLLYVCETWTVQKWQKSRRRRHEVLEEGGETDKMKLDGTK